MNLISAALQVTGLLSVLVVQSAAVHVAGRAVVGPQAADGLLFCVLIAALGALSVAHSGLGNPLLYSLAVALAAMTHRASCRCLQGQAE